MTDPRVLAGLRRQVEQRRETLARGASRVGWKIGLNDPAVQGRLGLDRPVIGHLTSETLVEDGGAVSLEGTGKPAAEVEVAIELRRDVPPGSRADAALAAIESLGPAIEVIDAGPGFGDLEEVVAANVFHHAVLFGEPHEDVALAGLTATLAVDGQWRSETPIRVDLGETILLVANLLGEVDELLSAGDRIIAGALLVEGPLRPGSELRARCGALGSVGVRLA